jgi:drug/metabolite transporter (DMT)-like permease
LGEGVFIHQPLRPAPRLRGEDGGGVEVTHLYGHTRLIQKKPMTHPSYRKAMAVLIIGACIIGFAPIFVRLSSAGPAATGFWRLAFALPILALLALKAGRDSTTNPLTLPPMVAILAGLAFAADLGFWHYAIGFTTVANATVLSNLTPIVVMAVAWIMFKETPQRLFLAGLLLAISGAFTLAHGAASAGTGRNTGLGDALAVGTALWYALYFLAVRKARQSLNAAQVMFWSSLAAAPCLMIFALILNEPLFPTNLMGWLACLGLALVHVAGQGSIAWALGRLPTAITSLVVLIQPVVAAILGWILFAEAIGPWQCLGAALTLSGVILAQWSASRVQQEQP